MRSAAVTLILGVTLTLLIGGCSHPADVASAGGTKISLEISTMESVDIRGSEQWIYASGASEDNPVILWLDGGPGGSEVGWVRKYLGPLHEIATVVCWDQRGTARSYKAGKHIAEITVDDYVRDVIALSEYLISTYDKKNIYLVGHSWGSVIGVLAAQRRPDLYAAYIGSGQHVNSIENDTIGWEMIHAGALAAGEKNIVKRLEEMGKPPYLKLDEAGNEVPDGDAYYYLLSKLYRFSPKAPSDHRFNSIDMFLAPEHRLLDRINLIRGIQRGVKNIYPQLAFHDLEEEVKSLDIPAYLINGTYDFTCVSAISARWFNSLSAPGKELLQLEDSGHNGIFTEPEKVIEFFRHTVLR